MKNSDINININSNEEEKEPVYVRVAKWFTKTISEAKWYKIFKVFIVTFLFLALVIGSFFVYSVASDKETLRNIIERMSSNEEGEDIRDFVVTPKIQHELEILVYSIDADRAFIFELHNGKKNTSGLPFRFADMTYEEVNEDKKQDKVAMQFQNIPLTLYKYPHFLQKQKTMIGTVEEIEMIDPDFADHIKDIGGKYLGMIYLNRKGTPLGFLCVSFHSLDNIPSKEVINKKLTEYGKTITHLLDLRVHMKE